jgi:virulence-associated protein VapD
LLERLGIEVDWFTPSVGDIRMLSIEENNDLKVALEDDGD